MGKASSESRGNMSTVPKLVKDDHTGVLNCEGRMKEYRPIYLHGGVLAEKVIFHIHNQVMHLGVANTTASVRETWWIPKLRVKVKKVITHCNICKVYATKPYGVPSTSSLPEHRTEGSRLFEVTGWTLPDTSCTRSVRKKKESAMSLFSPVPAPEQSIWRLHAPKRQMNSRVS